MRLAFIDIEHHARRQPPNPEIVATISDAALRAYGQPITLLYPHYPEVDTDWLAATDCAALFLSGNCAEWRTYAPDTFDTLAELIRNAPVPLFAFCGGHQLLAMTYGAPLSQMGWNDGKPVREDFWNPPGTVARLADDPIFAELGDTLNVRLSHHQQVATLPAGFVRLASTPLCPIQLMRSTSRGPVRYGAQFHPEQDGAGGDGTQLLTNFLHAHVPWRNAAPLPTAPLWTRWRRLSGDSPNLPGFVYAPGYGDDGPLPGFTPRALGRPAVAATDERIDLLLRGPYQRLWQRTWAPHTGWQPWHCHDDSFPLAAAPQVRDSTVVRVLDYAGKAWCKPLATPGVWQPDALPWEPDPLPETAPIAFTRAGRREEIRRDASGIVWHRWEYRL